jgi:DUF1680 family protein
VALHGELFFYVNPLASAGKHHRQPFFSCACCPSNVVRFIPSVPGYVYAVGDKGIYVNLYVAGTGKVKLGKETVKLTQETQYPWDGKVKLTVEPEKMEDFAIKLRVPGWCENAQVKVRGAAVKNPKLEKGYLTLTGPWKSGDVIELDMPMDVQRFEAHPLVKADAGRVAIQRGPVVYCFEGVDNDGRVHDLTLPPEPKFTTEHRADLLGGVTVVKTTDQKGRSVLAVPYHVWDHRQPGEMAVWVMQEGKSPTPPADEAAWQGKLYRKYK